MTNWTDQLDDPARARVVTQYSIEYALQFVISSRKLLGNDFDAAVVLCTIQVYVGEKAFRLNSADVRNMSFAERFPDELLVPISRLAIANLTGLPKETVRRKVLLLERRGFIRRVGSRGLAISHEFAASDTRAQMMRMNLAAFRKLLERMDALDDLARKA